MLQLSQHIKSIQCIHVYSMRKQQMHTWSLWSPPTIFTPKMCSSSSRSSNLSLLVVAGRPDLTFTSLTLPISRSPCTTHLLTNGLYLCGWSNLLTNDHTYETYQIRKTSIRTIYVTISPPSDISYTWNQKHNAIWFTKANSKVKPCKHST